MKIHTKFEDPSDDNDFRERLTILVDDKKVFGVYDGEPEDNTLARNFNDCYNVVDLMKKAYEAGACGEELIITEEMVTND